MQRFLRVGFGRTLIAVSLAVLCAGIIHSVVYAVPISLHPDNPHYYLFKGQPAILITSAELYGAVLNLDFDYVTYLNTLAANGMNYTRIYPGAYFEKENQWFQNQSLGPTNEQLCLPWSRSKTPGYVKGGNLFDLDTWNPPFFNRLKDFIIKAGERGIVVEVCLFNCHKDMSWDFHPMYHACNVNNVGYCSCTNFQTLCEAKLVGYQKAYVRKITQEVNEFDNVILEIIDEPTISRALGSAVVPWISEMLDTVVSTESQSPKKHLIAQQMEGGTPLGSVDFSADPRVSIILGQYVWQNGNQIGAMKLLDGEYDHNKMIELNETDIYPVWYTGDKIAASRVEAWEFIVGGGGSFNQLNGLYTTINESASGTEIDTLFAALKNLKEFMYSFNFIKMRRDTSFIVSGVSSGAFARGISEPGRQYALYIHHSKRAGDPAERYEVVQGTYRENLVLNVAAGYYTANWIDPATGKIVQTNSFSHSGGNCTLTTPQYSVDIALRIKNTGSGESSK